jgi:hypothetical protein
MTSALEIRIWPQFKNKSPYRHENLRPVRYKNHSLRLHNIDYA